SRQRAVSRIFLGGATAAIIALAVARPLTEIAQDETAIAMFFKSARIVPHHAQLLVLELTPGFEFSEVDAVQCSVVRFEDSYAGSFSGLDSIQISIAM